MRQVNVSDKVWQRVLSLKSGKACRQNTCWAEDEAAALALYEPLASPSDAPLIIAQIGQSLDGRIATDSGDARDVSGPDGLAHLHRLRALADAVVVGVNTALHDDPQLTVRLTNGDSPARVVIDPHGRLPNAAKLLQDNRSRRIVVQAVNKERPVGVEAIVLPWSDWISPHEIIAALTTRGFRRILIEGGGTTITQFLEARLLNRLHVAIAPLLIGSGPQSLTMSPISRLSDAMRPEARFYNLGSDVLFDCKLFETDDHALQHVPRVALRHTEKDRAYEPGTFQS